MSSRGGGRAARHALAVALVVTALSAQSSAQSAQSAQLVAESAAAVPASSPGDDETMAGRDQAAAAAAQTAADSAYRAAVNAATTQAQRSAVLQGRRSELERQFGEAQRAVPGLDGPRQRYQNRSHQNRIAERDREQVATSPAAAGLPAAGPGSHNPAQAVIDRASRQLGVRYSWGGGNASGPTVGIRDGGVGDAHGDYRQVGFDCSGLMIYAFAGVLGYSLPHYSGLQYRAGPRVPLAARRPGDMLFWGSRGRINHVALYIGNEQMIEAPYSGAAVRVAPVRYRGIMPYVTRIL